MSLQESLTNKAKELIALMRSKGLSVGRKEDGQWTVGVRPNANGDSRTLDFEDIGTIDNFTGNFFVKVINGRDVYYFNPPGELGLEHDDSYDSDQGYWKKQVLREIKAARNLVDSGISAPKSSSELRSWDSHKISKYLLGEAENYEVLYACIISQLRNVNTNEAQTAIEQLTELMETKTDPVQRTKKSSKVDEGDIDELAKGFENMNTKPRQKIDSPKKPSSPPKKASPKGSEKMDKLIAKYKQRVLEKGDTATMADAIKRLGAELGFNSEYMEDKYDFYGFGRSRHQPNRRKSRRRSNKKVKTMMMKMRRTSGVKRKVRRTSGKSLKKNKHRTSRKKSTKKSFGSTIYGLQGGMQNGPIYKGVFPMTLKVNETLPNLNNVKRSFSLNEFGARKKKRAPKNKLTRQQSKKKLISTKKIGMDRRGRRGSKLATVVDSDDSGGDGNSFGCGLYGCGRGFGKCGCDE
jgi:hypothetical protein